MQKNQTRKRRVNKLAIFTILMVVVLCIAGFAFQEKISLSGNEASASILTDSPVYNQKTDSVANEVYLTTSDLNVREEPSIEGKLMGTLDASVSVTIEESSNPDWVYVKEFKGYVNKTYLKKVDVSNVIGVLYTRNDTNPYLTSKPYGDEDNISESIDEYRTFLIRPTLYNDEYYKVGDNSYINKNFVVVEYYEKNYYEHFIMRPTSRGFTEYTAPVIFHRYIGMNICESSNLSVDEIALLIKDTPFEGIAPALKEIDDNGVNALFALSVAILESGNGHSYLARNQNNIFGLDPYNGGMSFSTKSDCVKYFGKLMTKHYFANGRNTLYDINQMYEPYNSDWSNLVSTLMYENRAKVNR